MALLCFFLSPRREEMLAVTDRPRARNDQREQKRLITWEVGGEEQKSLNQGSNQGKQSLAPAHRLLSRVAPALRVLLTLALVRECLRTASLQADSLIPQFRPSAHLPF